jgi:hypothetical protein
VNLRVLVVEDIDALYEYFMNVCENLLPVEKFEFVNAQTVEAALEVIGENWDVIVMDYYLGSAEAEKDGVRFQKGTDLIAYRRELEAGDVGKKKAHIVGISASRVHFGYLSDSGADEVYLKLDAPKLAKQFRSLLE